MEANSEAKEKNTRVTENFSQKESNFYLNTYS